MNLAQRPKVMVVITHPQKLYLAPPDDEERAMLARHNAYIPTESDIAKVADTLGRINDFADMVRPHAIICYAVMEGRRTMKITNSLPEITAHLGDKVYGFYGVTPRDGDLFVTTISDSIHTNSAFNDMLPELGYLPILHCGVQASNCVLAGALKYHKYDWQDDILAAIHSGVIRDLAVDTYVAPNGSLFRPMPDPAQADAKYAQHNIPVFQSADVAGMLLRQPRLRFEAEKGLDAAP